MRSKILLSILLAFASIAGHSQKGEPVDSSSAESTVAKKRVIAENEGVVKFLVDVDNGYFEVLANDTLLIRRYEDTLVEGSYKAKVWSPGYVTVPIDFDIKRGEVSEVYVNMAYNNAKQDFEREYKAYRNRFHKNLSLPGCITLGTALASGTFMLTAYDLRKKLTEDVALYSQAVQASEVDLIKDRIAKRNKNYNALRTSFYITGGLTIGMLATTIYTYTRFKKNNTEPTFTDKSPWHDKFSLTLTPYGAGFALKI